MSWFLKQTLSCSGLWLMVCGFPTQAANPLTPRQVERFEQHIRPFLVNDCSECHGAKKQKGGLRVDFRDGLLKGGDSGPAIVPGDARRSLLIQSITHEHSDFKMPKDRPKLADSVIAHFVAWVNDGAPDPRDHPPASEAAAGAGWESVFNARRAWWSFRPVQKPPLPVVCNAAWSEHPVDRFILAKLEEKGLRPAPPADSRTWLRRVSFAIIGLPPTPGEVAAFLDDTSTAARAKVVDRLLASPHFGERWARHWMDLVRFAETYGHEQDYPIPNAWQYRDYLIRAFNADVPYDQFVKEHIAGDLLKNPRRHPTAGFNESAIATGFWYLHQATHGPVDPLQDEADRIDNQIDVFSKTFLGLTVACARCHDHKFDAISTRDYYSLTAFLRGSRQDLAFLDPDGSLEKRADKLRRFHAEETMALRTALQKMRAAAGPKVAPYLLAAHEVMHGAARPGDVETNVQPDIVFEEDDDDTTWGHIDVDRVVSTASPSQSRFARPPGVVAADRGLRPALLESWVAELLLAEAQKPSHPLRPWLAAVAREQSRLSSNGVPPAPIVPAPTPAADPGRLQAPVVPTVYEALPSGDFNGWFASGQAFSLPANADGHWRVTARQIEFLPVAAAHSGLMADGLQGILRSPTFTLTHDNIHLRVAGQGGQIRLIIARYGLREFNPLLFEQTLFDVNTDGRFVWHSITSGINRHRGRLAYFELIDGGNGHVALERILFSNSAKPPPDSPALVPAPVGDSMAEVAQGIETATQRALDSWMNDVHGTNSLALLSWLSQKGLLDWGDAGREMAALVDRCHEAATGLPKPMAVLAMTDGSVEETRVFTRGDPKTPGPPVARRFLEAVAGPAPAAIAHGSGRAELAEAMVAESNPFLYRVIVNRVWAHLFGRGLVPTVDNFGAMGQGPTHPELLDYLAATFREGGGSMKQLIRSLCLTRTYQMSSKPVDPVTESRDPDNALLHRQRMFRLEGEVIRDSLLAVAGQLNTTQFGPSIPTYFTPFMGDRMWVKNANGPMDGDRRRSIYLETRRNFLSSMMLTFDLPLPDTTVGQRNRSNVPGQALALMNDPFVKRQADAWASELVRQPGVPARERIEQLFLRALARPPKPAELDQMISFLKTQAETRGLPAEAAGQNMALWADACHLAFMLKEFIHVP